MADKDILKSKKKEQPINTANFVSTGSTMLNLACTGKPRCGFGRGHYYFLVGDSSSGKTWLSLTCFAEAVLNPKFDEHRLIFDNAEDGALMDWDKFFGARTAARVEPPALDKDGRGLFSTTIEEFYYHLDDAKSKGKPFIYVLDSMDALSSDSEQDKVAEQKEDHRKGKAVTGSYGDGKAKRNSSGMRQIIPYLRSSGSILIVISQTRDNIGFGAQFNPKTRSGGRALTFYATLELWSAQAGHIKKKVKGKDRELGIRSQIRIKKNRVTGRDRTVEIPIYHSYGIDDIGSCIDYLIEEGHWSKNKSGFITAPEFEFSGRPEELARQIDESESLRELQGIVTEVWTTIEEACTLKRSRRYE